MILPCVEHEPLQPVDAAVIWLHGLGADGHDFAPIVPMLGTPSVRYVFPNAPAMPVTINGGIRMPAWYDIRSLDFDAEGREDPEHIARAAAWIDALIARELARGIAPARLLLAGFSQGAAMAMHVAMRRSEPLAGLIVLSGYLVLEDEFARRRSEASRSLDVLFGHGIHDDIVPVAAGRMARDAVLASGSPSERVSWREYPMGHEVCPPEIDDIGRWLARRLA